MGQGLLNQGSQVRVLVRPPKILVEAGRNKGRTFYRAFYSFVRVSSFITAISASFTSAKVMGVEDRLDIAETVPSERRDLRDGRVGNNRNPGSFTQMRNGK
jgi:hypothetical protein